MRFWCDWIAESAIWPVYSERAAGCSSSSGGTGGPTAGGWARLEGERLKATVESAYKRAFE